MATYLTLNIIVLSTILIVFRRRIHRPSRAWILTLTSLAILTLIFDNLLIALGIYEYASDKILGIRLWHAPIEDFMYPLLAVFLLPFVWNRLGVRHD